jgi:hypothetical protein
MSGGTLARFQAFKRYRQVARFLTMPAAGFALGAMFALWASAEANAPLLCDDAPHYGCRISGSMARPLCNTSAQHHPAKGANALLRFHSGQPQDFGAPCRNAS